MSTAAVKTINVKYLYLDLNTCNRCIDTDVVLDGVIEILTPALSLAGYALEYEKIEITNADAAARFRFLSSPTILVNGKDICGEVAEAPCSCCSQISGSDVDCRIFHYEGKNYDVPPAAMLAEGILKQVFSPSAEESRCCAAPYTLPENLSRFFEGKEKTEQGDCCSCGCNC